MIPSCSENIFQPFVGTCLLFQGWDFWGEYSIWKPQEKRQWKWNILKEIPTENWKLVWEVSTLFMLLKVTETWLKTAQHRENTNIQVPAFFPGQGKTNLDLLDNSNKGQGILYIFDMGFCSLWFWIYHWICFQTLFIHLI